MSSIYYSRKHASTIILTIIVVVLISLCSKTYAIKNEQQIQDRNRNSGNTEYFLNQGKDNIERNEENNNRNSKEIMNAANKHLKNPLLSVCSNNEVIQKIIKSWKT